MNQVVLSQKEWVKVSQMILQLKEKQLLDELRDCVEIEDVEIKEKALISLRKDLLEFYSNSASVILAIHSKKSALAR